jgi:phosphatidylinositol dimannoside acyltransferase
VGLSPAGRPTGAWPVANRAASPLTVVPAPGRASYLAYRAAADFARVVPVPVGRSLARGVSWAAPAVMTARRQQVARNLRRVHGGELDAAALRRGVAGTFDSYGRYFYELFRLPYESPEWIEAHFEAVGLEHIERGVAAGRGVVAALPHLGNWDLAGAWLAGRGFRVTVVVEPVEPADLFRWFVETRTRLGMRVVTLANDAGRELLGALARNEVVCLLCDRDLTGDGISVEFFGERTTMPGGPAMLALRSGAPLVPVGCYFRPGGRQQAVIGPPLDTTRTGTIREDVTRLTQELAGRFESLISAEPESWHLMQPNWPSDRMAST